jgi:hypothetical protein
VAAETGFLIDGKVYEVPSLDSLDMDERRVMFDLCGLVQEDFVREEDEDEAEHDARVSRQMRHPGFMEALMHVAYQRGNPTVKRQKVQMVISKTNYFEAVSTMVGAEEDTEEVPLGLTSEPDKPSSNSTTDAPTSSGDGSSNGSDQPDRSPEPTGAMRSDTSSPASPRTELVA